MRNRNRSDTATPTTISTGGGLGSGGDTFDVADATGWPQPPFIARIGDAYPWEIVLVESRSGTTFSSLTRGLSSSSAQSHAQGADVVHVFLEDALVKQQDDRGHVLALVQDENTGYPTRPDDVLVVDWFGWDEPPIDSNHPYDRWTQIDAPGVPPAPTNVSAAAGDGEATITWDDVTGESGYRVYRNTADSFSGASQVSGDLAADTTSFTDTGVSNGTQYFWWVTAFSSSGESAESASATATPSTSTSNVETTDFSEYPTGSQPSDWTETENGDGSWSAVVESDANALQGGQVLGVSSGGDGTMGARYAIYAPTAFHSDPDQEVLALAEFINSPNFNALRILVRGDAGSDNTYFLELHGDGHVQLRAYKGDSSVDLSSETAFAISQGDKVWARFRVNGTDLQAKVWQNGDGEPSSWTVTVTDSDISNGSNGVGSFNEGNDFHLDYYAVGLGGDSPSLP